VNHDQNFKNLILDYPRQAIEFFAAEEMAVFDGPLRITPVRQEQLKHRLKERHRELDVPLLVEWPSGDKEMILFALEEETQSSRFSIHRLAHYCIDLGEMFQLDRIVPVVIFLNNYRGPTTLSYASDSRIYLQFNFLFCELSVIPWQKFRASSNIVARLNLPNMSYPKGDKVDVYASAMQGLFQLEPAMDKQFKCLDFVDLYSKLEQ